ncbi:MAG: hypothetical protein RSG48_03395, partial [Clostridia bacterium]
IIVIIILAAAVILTLNKNNPIENANEATFKSDLSNMKEELNMYVSSKYLETQGKYDINKLNATKDLLMYDKVVENGKTIKDVIQKADKYIDEISIVNGKLQYRGTNEKRQLWAANILDGVNNAKVETAEGINNVSLNNSILGNVLDYKIYGNSIPNGDLAPAISLGEDGKIDIKNSYFVNGAGELKNNTDFESMTYEVDSTTNRGSSFSITSSWIEALYLGNYVEVNPTKAYTLSADFKANNIDSVFFAGLVEFDSDKMRISPLNVMYTEKTLTYLTEDLKNGDTVVHLNDISNWLDNLNTPKYQLGFIFWNYKDYPEFTYSRNAWDNLFDYNSINKQNNTITLKSPWNKGDIAKNTKLSQSNSWNDYNYSLLKNNSLSTNWITKSAIIQGVNEKNAIKSDKFRTGTKYVKFLILNNYNRIPNTKLNITNVSLTTNAGTIDLTGHQPLRKKGEVADYIDYASSKIVRKIGKNEFDFYVLENPIYEPIDLPTIPTFKDITNIQVKGNIDSKIEVKYLKQK